MTVSFLVWNLRFVPLDPGSPKFFGFSEFLTGLALMVLAWTIADVRYRFRLRTAPLPLQGISFTVMSVVGVLTLMTDLWRAQGWPVLEGNILTPASWQAILGGAFLLTFMSWAWFGFIRPSHFGMLNARRYAYTLYGVFVQGSPHELRAVAAEFARSARAIVRYATDQEATRSRKGESARPPEKASAVTEYADDILRLIGDKRFCRAIVESSPGTALAVFQEMAKAEKYDILVKPFAKNIVSEALANKNSFLFHEVEGYKSGLIGAVKPLSRAMFSDYRLVESVGTLLDPDVDQKWDAAQWGAYCRVVLMAFRGYAQNDFWNHSSVLFRAKTRIEGAASDLYTLNGVMTNAWENDATSRLRVVVDFIVKAIETLDEIGVPDGIKLRVREYLGSGTTFYDHFAQMIFEVMFSAAEVKSPADWSWSIQHNSVWGKFFNFEHVNGAAGKVVKFKVRRLIYDEIAEMNDFPNYQGAKFLGFCLNVMGFEERGRDRMHADSIALQRAVLSWTRKNFAKLYSFNPRVALAGFVDNMSYDEANQRIVREELPGLSRVPERHFFVVDPGPIGAESKGK